MSWKKKTCKTCYFRVIEQCRKLPPTGLSKYYNFPIVKWNSGVGIRYETACSLYQEKDKK